MFWYALTAVYCNTYHQQDYSNDSLRLSNMLAEYVFYLPW